MFDPLETWGILISICVIINLGQGVSAADDATFQDECAAAKSDLLCLNISEAIK